MHLPQLIFLNSFFFSSFFISFVLYASSNSHLNFGLTVLFSLCYILYTFTFHATSFPFHSHSCHGSLPSTSRSRSLPCLASSLGLVENQLEIPHLSNSESPALAPFITMAFPCLVQVLGVSPFSIFIFLFSLLLLLNFYFLRHSCSFKFIHFILLHLYPPHFLPPPPSESSSRPSTNLNGPGTRLICAISPYGNIIGTINSTIMRERGSRGADSESCAQCSC